MAHRGTGFNREPNYIKQRIKVYSIKEFYDTENIPDYYDDIIVFHNMVLAIKK